MKKILICAVTLALACTTAHDPTVTGVSSSRALSEAERVVQVQLEAYNRRDLEAFLATYGDDIRVFDHPNTLRLEGLDQMRDRYRQRFASPGLHARIISRIVHGDYVIDHEHVTGLPNGAEIRTVAIYEVRDRKIRNVWFVR